MPYQFYTADVFTAQMFGGNQLAIFPEAEGLTSTQMQLIAREFNYSETVFVFAPETVQGTFKLRIFTPHTELPFAGHPTVGTAYVLAAIGMIHLTDEITRIIFEEGVGLIQVKIESKKGKPVYTELSTSKMPEFGPQTPSISELAAILSIQAEDILTEVDENLSTINKENNSKINYSPQAVSCGIPFLFIPVLNRRILAQIHLNREQWQKTLADYWAPSVYVFCVQSELVASKICSRMFAPSLGIDEDPATGAAATALAGYLGVRESLENGSLSWQIEQGFEMGRPSLIQVQADKQQGKITAIRVGGASVLVSQGVFNL
jgi:trans-2,3-dihydro-3-hydroxyanthranilate isomerase